MPGGLPEVRQVFTAESSGYSAAIAAMIRDNQALVKSVGDVQRKIRELGGDLGALSDRRIRVEVTGVSEAIGQVAALKKELDGLGDRTVHIGGDNGAMLRELRDISAGMDMLSSSAGRMEEHLGIINRNAADSSASLDRMTQMLRDNADAHNAAAAAVTAHAAANRNASGGWGAAAGAAAAGGGGRGGGGWWAAAAAAGGGGGGGGGGPAPGTAAAQFATVAAFTRRWYPAAHWAMMLTNEVLATVGPAAAAGGMGALVGMQGAEQAIPRLKAVFATAESLGSSLNTTAGQYMGLKTPALQNAQNLATGATFEGIGALTNIMRAGGGTPFIQLGSNTVSMWSRMMASLTTEFQKGLGKQLGGLVSGGTGYLQQFGNVFGNLGHTFLNVAPNLPGAGGDLLGLLSGGTRTLSQVTGWLGPALGPILGFEAGARWLPPVVGGAGRLLATAGRPLITAGTALSGAGAEAGLATRLGAAGMGAGEGIAGAGRGLAIAGGVLGSLTAPEIGVGAAMAYMLAKGATYQTPGQHWAGGLVSQVNQAGIAQSMPMAIAAMQKLSRVKGPDYPTSGWQGAVYQDLNNLFTTGRGLAKGHPGALVTGVEAGVKGFWDEAFGGKTLPTNVQAANTAISQLSQGLVNAFGAGQQVSDQWQKLSGHAVGMGKAFDIATMAQLQLGSSFEKNGKMTAQAKQMIANLYAGYQPMGMNTGQFGAAVGAQTAMSGLQHTQLAAVNQAYDQLAQIVTGGTSGAANLFGMLGGTPTTFTRGGIRIGAGPGITQMAKALTSFTTPQGAAAWNTFSNPQSGLVATVQSQLDWLRTAQTMGALQPGQTTGMAAFDIAQLLPMARKSPAALAQMSMLAQQFGGPAFGVGASAGTMFGGLSKWAQQNGLTTGGYGALMTRGTEGMANIGRDANQFVQQVGSGIGGALAQGIATHGATLQDAFMSSVGGKGGFSGQALGKYTQFLAGSGVPLKGAQDMVSYAAKLSGATPAQVNGMMGQLKKDYEIFIRTHADTSGADKAKTALAAVKDKNAHAKVNVEGAAQLKALQTQIDAMKSKTVQAVARAMGAGAVAALNAEIAALHSKEVTITTRMITIGGMAGVTPGIPVGVRAPGLQTGRKLPGYGGGDILPIMAEPGELILPKHAALDPMAAALAAKYRVPGYAGGGFVGQQVTGPLSYWGAGSSMAMWNPAMYAQILAAMEASQGQGVFARPQGFRDGAGGGSSMAAVVQAAAAAAAAVAAAAQHSGGGGGGSTAGINLHGMAPAVQKVMGELIREIGKSGIGREFSVHVVDGIRKAITTGAAANALKSTAQALVSKLQQEVSYAKGTATSMQQGLNLGGMNLDPATGNGPVQTQMQSYAGSMQSFLGDLKTVRKGHLNKDLISQMIAAGPVQGDALAQSIMGGPGGIKGANQLDNQIGKLSRAIGAQAAMAQYGGYLSPDLKNATVVGKGGVAVNISVNAGKSGSLDLTKEQIAAIVAQVQAALLKQAKRNTKTGTKLPGKSS